MNSKSKNYYIEFLRFLFCVIILLHHSGFVSDDGSGLLPSGGVIADAFFMLTGYFACRHIATMKDIPQKKMKYSVVYTLKKLVKVLPYAGCGVVMIYLLEILHMSATSFSDILNKLYYMIVEILLLPMAGIINTDLISFRNAPLWYLSAVLIALPVIMYMQMRFEDVFTHYLVWILPLLLQGYMVRTYGGALPWMDFNGLIGSGVIRGFSSMTMGFAIYYASQYLGKKYKDGKGKILFTVLELVLLILVLCNIYRGVSSYDEIGTIYMIGIMLTISLSGISYTSNINVKAFGYLGAISLPVYCIHWGMYKWVSAYLGYLDYYLAIAVTAALCIVVSIILMLVVKKTVGKKQA